MGWGMAKVTKASNSFGATPGLPKVFLTAAEVCEITRLSVPTVYAYMAAGKFPQSVCMGQQRTDGRPSKVAWMFDEVMQWAADLALNNRAGGKSAKASKA
jgi:predicted DNA-binding transcriptional regulator AlpA